MKGENTPQIPGTKGFPRIGFAGLGLLGAATASRFIDLGIQVTVWNRSAEKCAALDAKSANICTDLAELSAQSDWIFSCLSDDKAMFDVLALLLKADHTPQIHVSLTTASPGAVAVAAARTRAAGAAFLCCPVMGRPDIMLGGKAGFLLSGDKTAAHAVLPVLEWLGSNAYYLGEKPEAAAVMKLVVNCFIALNIGGLTEAVAGLERLGISGESLLQVLAAGPIGSPLIKLFGEKIVARDFDKAMFSLELADKDLGYFSDMISGFGDFALATAVGAYLNRGISAGHGNRDWAGLAAHLLEAH